VAYSVHSLTLAVDTETFGADVESLKYQYFVTGGKIVGGGAKVNWKDVEQNKTVRFTATISGAHYHHRLQR
jgi:hypothetical protein